MGLRIEARDYSTPDETIRKQISVSLKLKRGSKYGKRFQNRIRLGLFISPFFPINVTRAFF